MNLQLSLLILGGVVIGLVFALSRYSDVIDDYRKKFKKQALLRAHNRQIKSQRLKSQRLKSQQEPVLGTATDAGDNLDEPLFNFKSDSVDLDHGLQQSLLNEPDETVIEKSHSQPGFETETEIETRPEPDIEATPENTVAAQQPQQEERITSLKPAPSGPFTSLRQIDYWIKLSPASPVTQGEIMEKLGKWEPANFATQIHALTQEEPHWVDLADLNPATLIVDVVASYQLLESGQASSIEDLRDFDQLVSALGEGLEAEKLMMASPEQAFEQSQRLERFYEQSHGPLEVSVSAPEGQAFMGKLVETSAKQQGLDYFEGDYVRLKRMANESIILYRMCNNDAPHFVPDMSSSGVIQSIRFSMIPSLSRTPGRDAKEMLDAVKAFASRVKGDIRIPGQKEFHQDQLLNLRNRVSKLEKEMIDAGLEPGSQEILRIFS